MHTSIAPTAAASFSVIAERFRRAGQFDRAVAVCREGLAAYPEHLSARVTLGCALLEMGQHVEAHRELQAVLRRAPDNLAAIRGLADLHARGIEQDYAQDMQEAEDALLQEAHALEAASAQTRARDEYLPVPEPSPAAPPQFVEAVAPAMDIAEVFAPVQRVAAGPLALADLDPIVEPVAMDQLDPIFEPVAMDQLDPIFESVAMDQLDPIVEPVAMDQLDPVVAAVAMDDLDPIVAAVPMDELDPVIAAVAMDDLDPIFAPVEMNELDPIVAALAMEDLDPIAAAVAMDDVDPILAPAAMSELDPIMAVVAMEELDPIVPAMAMEELDPIVTPVAFEELDPVVTPAPIVELAPAMMAVAPAAVEPVAAVAQLDELDPIVPPPSKALQFEIEDVIAEAGETFGLAQVPGASLEFVLPDAPAITRAPGDPVPVPDLTEGPIAVLDEWLVRIRARRSALLSEYAAS